MARLSGRLEELFLKITFAEDRDFPVSEKKDRMAIGRKLEDTFAAAAFAEAGEFEAAASYLNRDGDLPKSQRVGRTGGRFGRPCAGRA